MNMKKISLMAIAISFVLSSCANLDLNPLSYGSSENWYHDATEIEMSLNDLWRADFFPIDDLDWDDDWMNRNGSNVVTLGTITSQWSTASGRWTALYKGITRSQKIIAALEEGSAKGLSDALVKQYLGEAYFMQGFAYGELATYFGDVVLNKEAINLAGHRFSGHTEIYAHYTGTEKYTMMLAHGDLRVVHVSTHVSLREACDRVKKARVLEVIQIAHRACLELGIEKPAIGVAGLNPHSGEHGLFGREEIDEIIPAIEAANAMGIAAEGPVPPDTVFSKARGGWYDIVLAMYHDQGHIPLKLVGFVYNREAGKWDAVEGVNITLGLPIVRVSVDHGTAFDQVGTGLANELSLLNAIDYAIRLSRNRGGAIG